MDSRITFCTLLFSLILGALSAIDQTGQKVLFGYSGENGPDKWGSLSPEYALCSSGKAQSPIDIKENLISFNKKLGPLAKGYHPVNGTLVNHIISVAMFFDKGAGGLKLYGKSYDLKQMHWHTPSEHRIKGVQYDAELHMVHQAEDSSLAVVAILYKIGDQDAFLAKIKGQLQQLGNEKCSGDQTSQIPVGQVDTKGIARMTGKYFRYLGSLTTPPCSEYVLWTVFGKVRTMSTEQIGWLKAPLDSAFKMNARPVHEINDRKLEMFQKL